jgi:hypothetical protein
MGEILSRAKASKARQGESPDGGFGYNAGSPVKKPDVVDRYAGEIFGFPPQGVRSSFAQAISDPKNKEAQGAMFDFTQQLFNGPFAPGGVALAGEGVPQEEMA